MFKRTKLNTPEDFFIPLLKRGEKGVYFYRLAAYNEKTDEFLLRYYKESSKNGIHIDEKIQNPDQRQLEFYDEIIGLEFQMNPALFQTDLKKWLPRLRDRERNNIGNALYDILFPMAQQGKPINILKNLYIKFMCWMYYRFESILILAGKDALPKVLYEGYVSNHELKMLHILSAAGCDILLVECEGDAPYLKIDPQSVYSDLMVATGDLFPKGYSLRELVKKTRSSTTISFDRADRTEQNNSTNAHSGERVNNSLQSAAIVSDPITPKPVQKTDSGISLRRPDRAEASPHVAVSEEGQPRRNIQINRASNTKPQAQSGVNQSMVQSSISPIMGRKEIPSDKQSTQFNPRYPNFTVHTNNWLTGDVFEDSCKAQENRGTDRNIFYNMFVGITGVQDIATYHKELLKWRLKVETNKRQFMIIEDSIPFPNVMEVNRIKRKSYIDNNWMITDLANQISFTGNKVLEGYAREVFSGILMEDASLSSQKLMNRAICILCWINKYFSNLLQDWSAGSYPLFLFHGFVSTPNEILFIRMLSKMPLDVFIINPDLSKRNNIDDVLYFDKVYSGTMPKKEFPSKTNQIQFGTTAYEAEQDLDTILYQDTGLYRERQFKKSIPITLRTTYEEIEILWDQDVAHRPDFETLADRVMVPVLFSKVSGVNKKLDNYWYRVGKMITEETVLITSLPYFHLNPKSNIKKETCFDFYWNKRLQIPRIKEHKHYPYSFIREEMQNHMLGVLDQMLERKLIRSASEKQIEYFVIATVLNIDKSILRMIQNYDFTKKVPKLLIVNTTESEGSLEDSILITFFNLLGFDITVFVPTGYRCFERYISETLFHEHQIGEYTYDLTVPDLREIKRKSESLVAKIFRRGR